MTNVTFKIINHGSLEYEEAEKLCEEILYKTLELTFFPEELEVKKDRS